MYIANTTKQNLRLNLRVPESKKAIVYEIPSGQQAELGRDWTQAQCAVITDYLDSFGAKRVDDLSRRMKHFAGILYSTAKPIPKDGIEAGHSAVVDHQTETASDEITKAALGMDRAARDPKTGRRTFKKTKLEVQQIVPHGQKPTGHEIGVGIEVSTDGKDDPGLNS